MICPYCNKDSPDYEYCEHCGIRLIPYQRGKAQSESAVESEKKKDTFAERYKKQFVRNTNQYSGFLWAIMGFVAFALPESRPIAIFASGFSLVKCIWYMYKNDIKYGFSIAGMIIDIFSICLYIWYYLRWA